MTTARTTPPSLLNVTDETRKNLQLGLLINAAENGDTKATSELAQHYFSSLKLPRTEMSLQHIEEGCLSGPYENHREARLAFLYSSQAVALGDAKAHFYLANLFLNGWGVKVDVFRAIEHANLGAKNNVPDAKDLAELIGLMVEHFYAKMCLGFRYQHSVFGTTNLSMTPDRHAKIIRRCLTITPQPIYARLVKNLEKLHEDANTGFAKSNPFNKKERFIINLNYALATKNKAQLNSLSQEDKALFNTLTQEEFRERAIVSKPAVASRIEEHKETEQEPLLRQSDEYSSYSYRKLGA